MTAAPSGTGQAPALPDGLFRCVWQESRGQQAWLCLLAAVVFPLTMAPPRGRDPLQYRLIALRLAPRAA